MSKQLLFLTNNQLTATLWQRGSLSAGETFENDAIGWRAFSKYLAGHRNVPASLLTDLIEEDFQRETIPHVMGKTRQNLIQRRLGQLYRDTPFRQATHQGREKDGRRDDRMLFSALTNAELPKPWMEVLLKEKVPLAGIFSVALLSPLLFKKLDPGTGHLLLVTHQSSGLRQSYFQNGDLRFSRLTPLTTQSPEGIAEVADQEMTKIRQFLASSRLLPRGDLIDIAVLAESATLQSVRARCPDTTAMIYRFIDLDEAPALLGLKNLDAIKLCDPLFLALLGSNRISGQYAVFEQTRFYTLWQARIALYMLSAATLGGGLFWTGGNGLALIEAASQQRQLELETQAATAQYDGVIQNMPVTVAKPQEMKAAVNLEQMIAQNAPVPERMLGLVSRALATLPQIKINQIRWQTSATDGSGDTPPVGQGEPPLNAALIGVPARPFEIIVIEGQIVPFQNDYRAALDSVRQFSDELGKNKQLQVEVTQPPIDIRPTVKLDGKAGKAANDETAAQARFELKLVWKP